MFNKIIFYLVYVYNMHYILKFIIGSSKQSRDGYILINVLLLYEYLHEMFLKNYQNGYCSI